MHHGRMNLKQETASGLSISLIVFSCENLFYDLGGVFFFPLIWESSHQQLLSFWVAFLFHRSLKKVELKVRYFCSLLHDSFIEWQLSFLYRSSDGNKRYKPKKIKINKLLDSFKVKSKEKHISAFLNQGIGMIKNVLQMNIRHENYLSSQVQKFRKLSSPHLRFGIHCAECLHWGSTSGLPLYSMEIQPMWPMNFKVHVILR